MNGSLRWFLIAAAALIAAWAGYRIGSFQQTTATAPDPQALDRLLAMPVQDLNGKPASLRDGQGKIRVINLWAAWCPPCRAEMPAFSRIHEQLSGKGVQFVGVALDDPSRVNAFLRETPVSYPVLVASPEQLHLSIPLGNSAQGLPFSLIVDANGVQVASKLGQWKETDLEAELQRLLRP